MKVVCPGSYDPITMGHLDVIARSTRLFDEVVVAVVHNPAKSGRFDPEVRTDLIRASLTEDERTKTADNITIDTVAGGLLVDYCSRIGAPAVVKGLRSGTDFAYELPMALMNKHLSELETIFVPGNPEFEHVSSSLIKEVHANGGDISGLVPACVLQALNTEA
ncbi:pantetheine-phosphate adenylyltransferase [Brevibacterium sp. GP-SGM9]|uniref:pantetheine-phosphate adenylyltransferase n=1 Tax=unclassified Brevibacterium TaxID=2614124 RepID=UPI001E28BE81|nr:MULTISPECIES: pantetheine-phosphate adenylyltransferase [unclassified Brevibacterium]MCD1285888.1 pantetheine-phosphate adenylyltransferase [Brevibacterium sp. CCUG 69071]MDK8434950.1 pantetheine-phosphate adenylyltransferase [Brevibacterium sp. H-BE7]